MFITSLLLNTKPRSVPSKKHLSQWSNAVNNVVKLPKTRVTMLFLLIIAIWKQNAMRTVLMSNLRNWNAI